MPTKTEFAHQARAAAETLRNLADAARGVNGAVSQKARDEAAEFLREAAADCDDAARAIENH